MGERNLLGLLCSLWGRDRECGRGNRKLLVISLCGYGSTARVVRNRGNGRYSASAPRVRIPVGGLGTRLHPVSTITSSSQQSSYSEWC